ncbi:TerD family protein [Streptomyces sp. NPDC004532]
MSGAGLDIGEQCEEGRLGDEGDAGGIVINLSALPATAHKVVVAAALDGSGTFADVGAIEITVSSSFGEQAVAQATLDAATTERSLILAEVYRRGPLWRIRAVGQGHDHDLAATARAFGVEITD